MALQSPALLSSILAFAAKHIDAIKFSNSIAPISPGSLSSTLQQRAVKLLAQEVHDLSKNTSSRNCLIASNENSWNRTNAILATMLVLCNVETVWPGKKPKIIRLFELLMM